MSVHGTVPAGRSAAGPRNTLVGRHPGAAFLLIGISAAWVTMAIPIRREDQLCLRLLHPRLGES
jgi:hypothetical protein